MKNRRALLIGVPEYDSDKIDNLLIVNQDIELLHSSLEKSGFSVRSLGTDGELTSTQNKIKQAIRKECKEAKNTDVLLLYFSGHGIHYQGKDYLVPSDADLDDAEAIQDYLIPTDLGEIVNLDSCNAQTIIFFIDACREGIKLAWKSLSLASFGKGDRAQISKRRCVLVFACESGQYSQYVSDENGFSLFSKALAEVIDPQYPATTLEQILKATQIKLNDLVQEHQKREQKIHYSLENSVDDNTLSRVICEGLIQEAIPEEVDAPWVEAILQSSLWQDQERDESSSIHQLKDQVVNIVRICWQKWQEVIQAFPQDAWRDQQFPLRMLESLDLLISRSEPPIKLTEAETALIIAVPFIREAVLANGVIEAAKANPLSLDEKGIKVDFGNALDKLHQSQPRFIRKAKRLLEQERTTDKDSVMTWLMHRCLLKTIEIWMAKSDSGYLSDEFINQLENFDKNKPVLVKETLQAKRLLELARCTLVDIERIDRDDRPDPLQNKVTIGTYRDEQDIREKMLAYLLKLAGLLAIDIRTLSDVLVDHIGLSDPLNPEDVLNSLNQARWNPISKGRTLKITCHHPAVDLALRKHIKGIDDILSYILRQVAEKQGAISALQGLPTHLLPDGITAEKQNNVPVYQTPHVNFQLAHDEIRELLMGEQLYGDPTLAIRELYQNALDACRYREARLEYLQQRGNYQGEKWEGKIIFRQAKDEQGREYIECEDNGIGMEMQHLSQCFARAGRRFADLPEFIEEQAEWLKCDPPIRLYPNSQFGVGVLSYFMLTDEIEVETCRLDHQGKPASQLQVRIPGSSGLFRMQDLGKGRDSGTRIRLYLNRTHYQNKPISCLEILQRLLWVADYKTEVKEFERQECWESGQLRHPELSDEFYVNANHPDLWWITEKGCILSDGLVTEELHPCVVVNLSRSRRPKLTVDRKKIIEWDRNWGRNELIKGWECLLNWSSLSIEWLWKLEKSELSIAEYIVNLLIKNNTQVSNKFSQIKVPLAEIGCCFVDVKIENSLYNQYDKTIYKKLHSHRKNIWQKYKNKDFILSPSSDSHIVPLPGDALALLLTTDLENEDLKQLKWENFPFLIHLIRASLILEEPLAKTFMRLQRFPCLEIKIPKITIELLGDFYANQEDLILLSVGLDGKKPWLDQEISLGHIIKSAIELSKPIDQIYHRLQKFAFLGVKLPKVNIESLEDFVLDQKDLTVLSENLDEKDPWIKQKISSVHIIKTSYKLGESVASTLQKLQKFKAVGFELPQVKIELFNNIYVTQEISNIVLREKKGRSFTSENFVSLLDILLTLNYYEQFEDYLEDDDEDFQEYFNFNEWLLSEITRIIEILSPFVALGIELQQIDLNSLKSLSLQDLNILDDYLLFGEFEWNEHNPLIIHLMESSYNLNKPISQILKSLQKFIYLGLQIPELSIDNLDDFVVTYGDFKNLSEYPDDGFFKWIEKGKITTSFIVNRIWNDILISSCIKKLQKYKFLGIKTCEKLPKNLDDITNIDLKLLFKNFDEENADCIDEISLIHILTSANWINEPLGKTIERFRKFTSIGIEGVEIPENIPRSLSKYKISRNDMVLLFNDLNVSDEGLQNRVTPLHIIQAATKLEKPIIEIVNSLQRFIPLGLDVPKLPPKIFSNYVADQTDMITFSNNLDGEAPWFKENIPNWQIVRASVALNETVATTLKRLQRFIPLGVEIPETNPDLLGDFIANQDDLIALSQDLDQREPWLENEVNINHILRVSMWLKQPVAKILTRLQKLAPLGFKIPIIDLELLNDLIVTQADLIVLSQDLDGLEPWINAEVSDFHITCASERLNEPVKVTLERLHRFSAILNLKLPE